MSDSSLPHWSEAFLPEHLELVRPLRMLESLSVSDAWGDGSGRGVKVAVIDSGIDASHPRVGTVAGGMIIEPDESADSGVRFVEGPHDDLYGHGTACAGIIRGLAPACELYSVRVLGAGLTGRGQVLAAGIRWAIAHGMDVVNLSLSSRSRALVELFHEVVDEAVFADVMLISAMNNVPAPTYPSQFAGVFSVAAIEDPEAERFLVNARPPAEFGAPGVDVEVGWLDGGSIRATGNSFAAPHVAGIVARVIGHHPGATVAEVKAIMRAMAANRSGHAR